MKTHAFFNPNRFVALIRQDLLLNRNLYWLTLAVSIGIIYLGLIYKMNLQPYGFVEDLEKYNFGRIPGWGYNDFFLFALLGLAFFVSLSFSKLSSKPKLTNLLMLPASNFEKYVYPLLFRLVVGVVLFALIFWVDAQLARWTMQGSEKYVQNHYIMVPFKLSMLMNYSLKTWDNLLMLSVILAIGVFVYAVPLFFRKQAQLKTVLAFFAVFLGFACSLVLFSHLLIPGTKGFDVTLQEFPLTEQLNSIILMLLIQVNLAWPFLLFIGYFKLKEKRL